MVAEDLLCTRMMTMQWMMPFVQDILFCMRLLNSKHTQVVCHYSHPSFEGHTVVAIIMEAMMAVDDLLWARMSNDDATDDSLHSGHPIRHAPAELTRDAGSMWLGASLL
jgi:hypothetical protein